MTPLSLQILNQQFDQIILADRELTTVPNLGISITADITAEHALIETNGQTLEVDNGTKSQLPTIVALNTELTILERNLSFVLLSAGGVCQNRHADSPKPVDLQLYVADTTFRSTTVGTILVLLLVVGNLMVSFRISRKEYSPAKANISQEDVKNEVNKSKIFHPQKSTPLPTFAAPKSVSSANASIKAKNPNIADEIRPSLVEEWRLFGEYQMESRFDPNKAKQKIIALAKKVPSGTKLADRIQEFLREHTQ